MDKAKTQFSSERLIIRRFMSSDWADMHEYLCQESVVKYEPYDMFTKNESKAEAERRANDESFWAVCLQENNKLIGNLYFNNIDPKTINTWELGYVFNAHYWGKGYATEACQMLLKHAFCNLNAHRVIAMCNPKNIDSWKLLERLKFRREGHLIQNIFFKKDSSGNPIWNDTYMYALLDKEYSSLKD